MAIQKLLQVGEVAALAGRGDAMVRYAVKNGQLRVAAMTGYGQRLFRLEDAEEWVRSLPPRGKRRRGGMGAFTAAPREEASPPPPRRRRARPARANIPTPNAD